MPGLRLGLKPPPLGLKSPLQFRKYLAPELVGPPPEKIFREYKIPEGIWGTYDNDKVSDCTCAGIAHTIMLVTSHTGKIFIPEKPDVMKAYTALTGYNPATGANDNGVELNRVLDYWRDVGIAGHKILQWGAVDHTNIEAQKHAIHIFAATLDGISLPASAEQQFLTGQPFDVVPNDGGSLGGHCVPRYGYGSEGAKCNTWGKMVGGTWAWWIKYLFQSTAVITRDWVDQATGLTPSGFPIDALIADLPGVR